MIEIREEMIVASIEAACERYKEAKEMGNTVRAERIVGWIYALETLLSKYAPSYLEDVHKLKEHYGIDRNDNYEDIDLDQPAYLRRKRSI